MKPVIAVAAALVAFGTTPAAAQAPDKPRVLVLTDIGNEPDDAESLVRFLIYANSFDIEGLLATTSRHQRDVVRPEQIEARVRAYGEVLPNLKTHAQGWPEASDLLARIVPGRVAYGMTGVGEGKDTAASQWIIDTVDRAGDDRPVWVLVWGGAVDLAQALWTVRATRPSEEVDRFVSRLRVYSISDQDDAGPWIRHEFRDIWWIVSLHAHRHYNLATWAGISGEGMYGFDPGGPNSSIVSNAWLEANVMKGPLGALYPHWEFIMEGDTPSFLGLIPNGLNTPERPDYGGWGGRYGLVSPWDRIWTDISDTVVGQDGRDHRSAHATIWRWREGYQNDFAGRMAWTVTPTFAGANHNPTLTVNGQAGQATVEISARPGERVVLSSAGSSDPDGDRLTLRWFQYREAEAVNSSPALSLETSGEQTAFVVPSVAAPTRFHVILEARDDGTPALFAYRRAIVTVEPWKPSP